MGFFGDIWGGFKSIGNKIGGGFGDTFKWFKGAGESIWNGGVKPVANLGASIAEKYTGAVSNGINNISGGIGAVGQGVGNLASGVGKGFGDFMPWIAVAAVGYALLSRK